MPLAVDLALVSPPAHVLAPPAAAAVWRPVVVRRGDTLWQLAITHRTTPSALVAKNHLTDGGHTIHVGQTLLIPVQAVARAATPARPAAPTRAATGWTYTVVAGDTLSHIAQRYRVSVAAIASANTVRTSALIFVGQRLAIPGTGAKPVPAKAKVNVKVTKPATPSVHTVRSGDTMSTIAEKYHVTLATLVAANRLTNPGLIQVGQRITIPSGGAQPGTSTSSPTPTSANTFAGRTYSDAIVAAANANRDAIARTPVPNRTQTAAMIRQTAIRHGVDPKLALAIAWQESGWSQRAVSVANAVGVMQVIPSSGTWASQLAGRSLHLRDTKDNITAGVVIIRALQSSATSREQAIAGYYQGLYSVKTKGMYSDTKAYVAAVLAHYARM